MTNMKNMLLWSTAIILATIGPVAAAEPCPPKPERPVRSGDSPLFNTIWTITTVEKHSPTDESDTISEHICPGDQLVFRQAHRWSAETPRRMFAVPGPTLADRWDVPRDTEIKVEKTPGGRLCFTIDLQHEGRANKEPHTFFFRRNVNSRDRIRLYGVFGDSDSNACAKDPTDDSHGGTLHGDDEGFD